MSVELTDREHQIIQQLILDRWNPHRINKKIVNHHGLTINQVKYMRSKPAFLDHRLLPLSYRGGHPSQQGLFGSAVAASF
jgi:hypothetical protein